MTKHKVHQGERLSTIAARYGLSHQQFLVANPDRETMVLPSGETVFRSLSTGDELELPALAQQAVASAPTEEPRALGAVVPQHPSKRPMRGTRPPLPKIGRGTTPQEAQAGSAWQLAYEERSHMLKLAEQALSRIDTPVGLHVTVAALQAARWTYYQDIQRTVKELGVYATFHATHVPNIAAVRSAIQALGQQVDVYGALVSQGGTEAQIADAYHTMRAAALALLPMLH